MTYTVTAADGSTISLTFGGTPNAASVQAFTITIPGIVLSGGNSIQVAANPNARFNISEAPQPPSSLPKTGDAFPLSGLLALASIMLAAMCWLGVRLRKKAHAYLQEEEK